MLMPLSMLLIKKHTEEIPGKETEMRCLINDDTLEEWRKKLSNPMCTRNTVDYVVDEIELELAQTYGIRKQAEMELSHQYRREMIREAKNRIEGNVLTRLLPWRLLLVRR